MEKGLKIETWQMITAIRESEIYRRYQQSVKALEQFPGVMNQLMDLRKKTIDLYEHAEEEELIEESEKLTDAYDELQRMPEVNAFLEAEEELVRTLQNISDSVLDSIDMKLPNP